MTKVKNNKKLILFDFDGVIVDTFDMIYPYNAKVDIKISREEYKDKFMGNIHESVKKMMSPKEYQTRQKKWMEMYSKDVLRKGVVPGMSQAIKNLAKRYTMVMISSTINSPIHAYLELHKLHHFFDTVYGADVHINKGKKIEMIFKKYNTTSNDCIFITDTVGDVLEASSKKIKSIVVTWGFHEKERFTKTPPLAFVDNTKQLVKEIDKHFK
ncbi:MAG: hypothetical protein CMI53_03800 [Parcubacteria group bacterium]|jgi:phosphoglycolate phosphatase|nr:hypothetical protein [Parcubacteria group bacterium]|tara:strand:- start:462 stop:1097 length:636 start_codon:yes stop_codon:yes gene_type:complete